MVKVEVDHKFAEFPCLPLISSKQYLKPCTGFGSEMVLTPTLLLLHSLWSLADAFVIPRTDSSLHLSLLNSSSQPILQSGVPLSPYSRPKNDLVAADGTAPGTIRATELVYYYLMLLGDLWTQASDQPRVQPIEQRQQLFWTDLDMILTPLSAARPSQLAWAVIESLWSEFNYNINQFETWHFRSFDYFVNGFQKAKLKVIKDREPRVVQSNFTHLSMWANGQPSNYRGMEMRLETTGIRTPMHDILALIVDMSLRYPLIYQPSAQVPRPTIIRGLRVRRGGQPPPTGRITPGLGMTLEILNVQQMEFGVKYEDVMDALLTELLQRFVVDPELPRATFSAIFRFDGTVKPFMRVTMDVLKSTEDIVGPVDTGANQTGPVGISSPGALPGEGNITALSGLGHDTEPIETQ